MVSVQVGGEVAALSGLVSRPTGQIGTIASPLDSPMREFGARVKPLDLIVGCA